jgi:hypothetical protein
VQPLIAQMRRPAEVPGVTAASGDVIIVLPAARDGAFVPIRVGAEKGYFGPCRRDRVSEQSCFTR